MNALDETTSDRVIQSALEAARAQLQASVSVALVDAGGHLLRFVRTDGAALASVDMAQTKAWTAVAFASPTHVLADLPALDGALSRPIAQLPGGVPLIIDGRLVGGLGVGGAQPDQDLHIAQAGAAALT